MNQMEIKVLLTTINEEDVLIFFIDEERTDEYIIYLNNDSTQLEIKKVFSKILELLFDNEIILKLTIEEGYSKGLYKEVCKEYIDELQKEISNTKSLLLDVIQ